MRFARLAAELCRTICVSLVYTEIRKNTVSKFCSKQRSYLLLCSLKKEEEMCGLTCQRTSECRPLVGKVVISESKGERHVCALQSSPPAVPGDARDVGAASAVRGHRIQTAVGL